MAGKISELTELTTPAAGDLIEIVDVSDTSMAATGTNKKIAFSNVGGSAGAVPWNTPSGAAVGGASVVHTLWPGCIHVPSGPPAGSNGAGNYTPVDGRTYAQPLVVPFGMTITSLSLDVQTAVPSSIVRVGFVPADANWVPTAGVISVATTFDTSTLYGRGMSGLSVALTTGRWLRLWRAEGGAPMLTGPNVANATVPALMSFQNMAWCAGDNWWPSPGTSSGPFVDTIAPFNMYGVSGSWGGAATNGIGYVDVISVTWTAI